MGFDYSYPFHLVQWKIQEKVQRSKKRRELKIKYQGQYLEKRSKNRKTVFLLMTPEHENLGDHAIAQSETDFLKSQGIDYVEITGHELDEMQKYDVLSLMNGCPILMQGGGYLGTLWFHSEEVLREIIEKNPKSGIIALPNTLFYEPGQWGQEEFEKSREIYSRHKDLHLYAREKTSYEAMGKAYRNVKLIPDMVFSMNKCGEPRQRNGCLLSLRHDCEKTRTEEQEALILHQVRELFGDQFRESDMVADVCIPVAQREQALEDKFAEFASAKLVVTDRLHGMVFCAITGTPCIVLDSKSPKVRGCYEWIRELEYIRFVDDVSKIAEEYRNIPEKTFVYDNSHLSHYYQELAEDIHQIFHWR